MPVSLLQEFTARDASCFGRYLGRTARLDLKTEEPPYRDEGLFEEPEMSQAPIAQYVVQALDHEGTLRGTAKRTDYVTRAQGCTLDSQILAFAGSMILSFNFAAHPAAQSVS